MATYKLYGSVKGDSRTARTSPGSQSSTTWVQTEFGRITVELFRDGHYLVTSEPVRNLDVSGNSQALAEGNVNLEQGDAAGAHAYWRERDAIGQASRARTEKMHVECMECGRKFSTMSMDPRCTCGSVDIEVA